MVSEIFAEVDMEQSLAESLPPELQIFSAPLAVGIEKLAYDTVTSVIQSDA